LKVKKHKEHKYRLQFTLINLVQLSLTADSNEEAVSGFAGLSGPEASTGEPKNSCLGGLTAVNDLIWCKKAIQSKEPSNDPTPGTYHVPESELWPLCEDVTVEGHHGASVVHHPLPVTPHQVGEHVAATTLE